jgi:hypothetical protein
LRRDIRAVAANVDAPPAAEPVPADGDAEASSLSAGVDTSRPPIVQISADVRQDFPAACVPIRRGEVVRPLAGLVA